MSTRYKFLVVAVWAFCFGWMLSSAYSSWVGGKKFRGSPLPREITVHRQFPDGGYDRTTLVLVRVVYQGGHTEESSPADGDKPLWSVSFDKSVTYYGSPVK